MQVNCEGRCKLDRSDAGQDDKGQEDAWQEDRGQEDADQEAAGQEGCRSWEIQVMRDTGHER